MDFKGPVFNLSGEQQWGCGECDSVSFWGSDLKDMHPSCVDGMKHIPGVDLCFIADNDNEWDIVFSKWSSADRSEFEYTRSHGGGLLSSDSQETPFYVDGDNPKTISLSAGESSLVIFPIKASGNSGSDSDFVLLVDSWNSNEINVEIVDEPDDDSGSSSNSRRRRDDDDYHVNLITEKSSDVSDVPVVQVLGDPVVPKNVTSWDDNKIFSVILTILTVFLVVLILVFLLAK